MCVCFLNLKGNMSWVTCSLRIDFDLNNLKSMHCILFLIKCACWTFCFVTGMNRLLFLYQCFLTCCSWQVWISFFLYQCFLYLSPENGSSAYNYLQRLQISVLYIWHAERLLQVSAIYMKRWIKECEYGGRLRDDAWW